MRKIKQEKKNGGGDILSLLIIAVGGNVTYSGTLRPTRRPVVYYHSSIQ